MSFQFCKGIWDWNLQIEFDMSFEGPNFIKIQFGGLQWMHSDLEIQIIFFKPSIFDKL